MKKILFSTLALTFLSGCELMEFAGVNEIALTTPETEAEEQRTDTGANNTVAPKVWQTQTTVYATMSLYFLFQDPDNSFGDEGDDFIPRRIEIPADVATLTVSTGNKIWGWGSGSNKSNARGDYREATHSSYHSIISTTEELRVGSLVGMWSDGTENNADGMLRPFAIGRSAQLQVPEGARELILGMHDGYEWKNNWGSQNVTLSGQRISPDDSKLP